jgi:DNA-binding PadR family transcriptional regulator
LIEGRWQVLPNGQQRRYYYITAKGQEVLAARLATWQDFSTAVKAVTQAETIWGRDDRQHKPLSEQIQG